jgi:acyl transferase domain-containing protein/acyl carrier protein
MIEAGKIREPIAIIGMSCRLPGAPSPAALWELVIGRQEGVTEYPAGRTPELDAFYMRTGMPDGPATKRGGFLPDIDRFDAAFFEISPREAEWLDPQQRLLLETGWEALEDAGVPLGTVERAGVFMGAWETEYERQASEHAPVADFFNVTGGSLFGNSSRLAFQFNMGGPDVAVNAACASSLVAVHLAVQSLRSGECSLALAGGANIVVRLETTQAFSRTKILSRDGRCKFGDAGADGYVRSEGAGVLVLKRYSDAVRDGDRVLALIRGTAVCNNGRSSGLLALPSTHGQQRTMRQALADGGVDPATVEFIEAHGTGTRAGDPVEIDAMAAVYGRAEGRASICRTASVKSNIGHPEAAAGVAGIIRAVMAIRNGWFPATLHVKEPNPIVDWETCGMRLECEGAEWPRPDGRPRRAGVNGLGLSGTNAHLVLEEAPQLLPKKTQRETAYLLPISAASEAALRKRASDTAAALQTLDRKAETAEDFCFTAAVRRTHLAHRVTVLGATSAELAERLAAFARGEEPAFASGGVAKPARKIAFVFPGQGSQWVGMGRELLRSSAVFRRAMEAIDAAIAVETGWSVVGQLEDASLEERLTRIDVVQPTLFAMEVALSDLWKSLGVQPDAVVGHSMGEIAAACVAGILSIGDAARIICRRSALLMRVAGAGAMVVVELTREQAEQAVAGAEDKVSIAVCNSPRSTVLSGDPDVLDEIVQTLEKQDIFCRWIRVDVASHSPQMDGLKEDLGHALAGVQPQEGMVRFCSTVRPGGLDWRQMDKAYWIENLRQPVLFSNAVEELLREGVDTFIEMSPHPLLVPFVEQTAENAGAAILAVGSLRREEPETATLRAALGSLFAAGVEVDWTALYPAGNVISLPAYPWQRERFWMEGVGRQRGGAGHPLLGEPVETAEGDRVWTATLSAETHPWLRDHGVGGTVLLPASAYLEMAVAAGKLLCGADATIEKLSLTEALALPPGKKTELQAIATPQPGDSFALRFFAREAESGSWQQMAECSIGRGADDASNPAALSAWEDAEFALNTTPGSAHARLMEEMGYDFGPAFRAVEWVHIVGDRALAQISSAEPQGGYRIHPAALDAALQVLARILIGRNGMDQVLLPVGCERLRMHMGEVPEGEPLFVRATAGLHAAGDIEIFDRTGRSLIAVQGMEFHPMEGRADLEQALFSIRWDKIAPGAEKVSPGDWLLVGGEDGITAELAAGLSRRGASVSICAAEQVLEASAGKRPSAVAWMTPLEMHAGTDLAQAEQILAEGAALTSRLAEEGAERICLVTRATQAAGDQTVANAMGAGTWGLFASIANEYPAARIGCIDLPADRLADEADALASALLLECSETRIALRSGGLFAARLVPYEAEHGHGKVSSALRGDEGYQLTRRVEGSIEGLELRTIPAEGPSANEVEIEVEAAGLNFRDVLCALGMIAGLESSKPGGECAGTVTRVGAGVRTFRPGDKVFAISPSFRKQGMLSSRVRIPESLVARMLPAMSFAEAAGIPVVFLTAWYGLVKLARLEKGESVLIHAASGGVGLAAIQVANWLGANVWATAGTEEKRAYVRALGIEHVMDSRRLDFSREIIEATAGRGVDVVLNSLAGPAIPAGLEALATYGRFVEIGRRDILKNSRIGLNPFQKNLSFFGVDLSQAVEDRREMVGAMLGEIAERFAAGDFHALPTTTFPVADAREAFRWMARAEHKGKVVIEMKDAQVEIGLDASQLRAKATYLITGGLGGVGLKAAEVLVESGARHLVLTSRGAASPEAQETIAALRERGAEVITRQADVSDPNAVSALFAEIRLSPWPLRGIFHAAGVLDDGVASHLTLGKFAAVMAGKVGGALAMDALLKPGELDFLLYASSAAGVLGTAGQANYAAANAVLDALAHCQRAAGIPAVSIDWGSWADIGLAAAAENRGRRLESAGIKPLRPEEGQILLRGILAEMPVQAAAMHLDTELWCKAYPAAERSGLLTHLRRMDGEIVPGNGDGLGELATLRGETLLGALAGWLRRQVASVLRLDLERVLEDKALRSMGMDSLMSLEFRNRIEKHLRIKLSVTMIWNYPTIAKLAGHLQSRLELSAQSRVQAKVEYEKPEPAAGNGREAGSVSQMSAADLLKAELLEADGLLKN